MKNYIFFDNKETLTKWAKNLIMFTAPAVAVFFAQLQMGVDPKTAYLVALLAFWGVLADALKKVSSENN